MNIDCRSAATKAVNALRGLPADQPGWRIVQNSRPMMSWVSRYSQELQFRCLRRLPPPNARSCTMKQPHEEMQETHMRGHPRQHSTKVPQESELPGGAVVTARPAGGVQTPWRTPLGASTAH